MLLSDFEDDPTLLVGDLEWSDKLELLLLERFPVLRNGNRSFMRAEAGVPDGDAVVDDACSGVAVEQYFCTFRLETSIANDLSLESSSAGGVWDGGSSLRCFRCSSTFSRVVIDACVVILWGSSELVALFIGCAASTAGFSACARGVIASKDSRTITVVSSEPVCEVWTAWVDSSLRRPEGVAYCSWILSSS